MKPVISETVGSMKLTSGELKENIGKECREDEEVFEAVSVWWIFSMLALKKVMKASHCVTVSR